MLYTLKSFTTRRIRKPPTKRKIICIRFPLCRTTSQRKVNRTKIRQTTRTPRRNKNQNGRLFNKNRGDCGKTAPAVFGPCLFSIRAFTLPIPCGAANRSSGRIFDRRPSSAHGVARRDETRTFAVAGWTECFPRKLWRKACAGRAIRP